MLPLRFHVHTHLDVDDWQKPPNERIEPARERERAGTEVNLTPARFDGNGVARENVLRFFCF